MHILVLGSSGNVGQQVVAELLSRGHTVTAFIHGKNPFALHPRLSIVQGDVHSANDIAAALPSVDAVMSCLGSWKTKKKDILSSAMTHLVPAMHRHNITRLISLTGSAARLPGERFGVMAALNRYLLLGVASKILHDAERHLQIIAESGLAWTVLRSPIMTASPTSDYHLSDRPPSPFTLIPRRAVVIALVDQLTRTNHLVSAPHITRKK